MTHLDFVKPTFDRLATHGAIGDSAGILAYAYLRVSTDEQAQDGRSGLPRQLEHIHAAALKQGYRIIWDMVSADDASGFEFVARPQLTRLRQELKTATRRASVVVMEHLDRLSRNADWHQGFLLDEFKALGVTVVFWKEFSSRIERSIMGAISQDGMEQSKQRMMEGNLHKARSGRVTARTPAYGYKLVDRYGQEGRAALKDTHYAIRDEEAAIVRLCFQRLIAGDTLHRITSDLEAMGVPPPKQYKHWERNQVRLFILNEVYKGDFYAHRWHHTTVEKPSRDGFSIRHVKTKVERPREEWIHIPVPALVTPDEWAVANQMLAQNKKMARRNAAVPFLLTGLVRCAHCGWKYSGSAHNTHKGQPRKTQYRGYRCPFYNSRPKYLREHSECGYSQIPCHVLDDIIWQIVCQALLNPQVLLDALDADATSQHYQEIQTQLAYLERELVSRRDDDDKLLRAYMAGAFDAAEYALRRNLLKDEAQRLQQQCAELRGQVLTAEQLEQRKMTVLQLAAQMQTHQLPVDPPFELKQRILKLVVDEIELSIRHKWLKLKGAIRGAYMIENNPACAATSGIRARHAPVRLLCLNAIAPN